MEQQSVSVAKAGVLCSLPARTCILAAANPSGGHYDRGKTVVENLRICPTILSRFDLVFILLDRADRRLDDLLTAHIQALHAKNQSPTTSQRTKFGSRNEPTSSTNISLVDRLKKKCREDFSPVPQELFQKYISYARKFCFPELTPEAADELKRFYLELRKTNQGVDSIPVTTRQLEALIRMTQARARINLSNEATVEHARDVLAIFRYTLVDVLSTDDGSLQMQRNINGTGMSQATQAKKLLQLLQQQQKTVFTFDELKDIASYAGLERNVANIVDSLNIQGFLIKRGQNVYKFIV